MPFSQVHSHYRVFHETKPRIEKPCVQTCNKNIFLQAYSHHRAFRKFSTWQENHVYKHRNKKFCEELISYFP
jgi:hypothetical protein